MAREGVVGGFSRRLRVTKQAILRHLDPDQGGAAASQFCCRTMRTFIFRCPATGYSVQGEFESGGQPVPTYVSQNCIVCHAVHLVNPTTGKLMAEEVRRPTLPT